MTLALPELGLVPPHSIEAEQALLGAIFLDNDVLNDIVSIVKRPEQFYRAAHQAIYEAMLALNKVGHSIDWITVANYLSKSAALDDAGGDTYLEEITVATPVAEGAEQYAEIVRDKAILRYIIEAVTKVRVRAYDPTTKASELRDFMRRAVDAVDGITSEQVPNMQEVIDLALQSAEEAYLNRTMPGWNIGHQTLNDKMLGWQKGGVTVIASPPGGGKSFSAYSLCKLFQEHNEGELAAFISLEMQAQELIERQIVHDSFYTRAVVGEATQEEKAAVERRIQEARQNPVQIIKPEGRDIDSILALIRSLVQRGFRFIVIDYIGLVGMSGSSRRSNDNQDAMNNIPRLKELADRTGCHLLILSQITKEGQKKSLTQFEMVDLTGGRGSAVSNDAHSVAIFFLLWSQRRDPVVMKIINGLQMATVTPDMAFGAEAPVGHRLFSDDEIKRIVFQKTVKGRRGIPSFVAYWRTDDDLTLRPLEDGAKVDALNRLVKQAVNGVKNDNGYGRRG
jgi:replicative DNA helicase